MSTKVRLTNGTTLPEPDHATAHIADLEHRLQRQTELLAASSKSQFVDRLSDSYAALLYAWRIQEKLFPWGTRRRAMIRFMTNGAVRACHGILRSMRRRSAPDSQASYQRWIEQSEPGPTELAAQRQTRLLHETILTVVARCDHATDDQLHEFLSSFAEQTYRNFELILVTDSEQNLHPAVCRVIETFLARFSNSGGVSNLHRAASLPAALSRAQGDFVMFSDARDTVPPFALFEFAHLIQEEKLLDLVYADDDEISLDGTLRSRPRFKPDWSPDLLRATDYIGNAFIIRRNLLEQLGLETTSRGDALTYDLLLRFSERMLQAGHIAKVLYHRRVRADGDGHRDVELTALREHVARQGNYAAVRPGIVPRTYRIESAGGKRELISIIIPNRDAPQLLSQCLDSISHSTYRHFEIVVVENHSRHPATFQLYESHLRQAKIRLLRWEKPFNYSAINNFAVAQARGEILLFLNNDTQVISPDWLERLLDHTSRSEVGATGAKLLYPDNTIQHAGMVLGVGPIVGHGHRHAPASSEGYCQRLVTVQNVSATTGACLMTRRTVFEKLDGFDEQFPVAFNDVDYCLRLRRAGYTVVWTPYAQLYHFESKTRGYDDTPERLARLEAEMIRFYSRWLDVIYTGDPYYNPNLTTEREDFSLRA